jgi:hypothetical protein
MLGIASSCGPRSTHRRLYVEASTGRTHASRRISAQKKDVRGVTQNTDTRVDGAKP